MREKEETEKTGLKPVQKTKIMTSSCITSWQVNGGKVETVTDFIFLGSKMTADGECSHERRLPLGKKAMTNLDSMIKSITLPTKVHLFKAMVFQLVMYKWET